MATILQPFAPWMRDLSRFMNTPGAASTFLPPADVLVSEDDAQGPSHAIAGSARARAA